MDFLINNSAEIVAGIAAVHALAVAVVNMTPTPADNQALARIYPVVEVFAGIISNTAKELPGERRIAELAETPLDELEETDKF